MPRGTRYQDDKGSVVKIIDAARLAHARPPTIRALASEIGVGTATMHSYLKKMADEGLVEWTVGHHRSLRVTLLGQALLGP